MCMQDSNSGRVERPSVPARPAGCAHDGLPGRAGAHHHAVVRLPHACMQVWRACSVRCTSPMMVFWWAAQEGALCGVRLHLLSVRALAWHLQPGGGRASLNPRCGPCLCRVYLCVGRWHRAFVSANYERIVVSILKFIHLSPALSRKRPCWANRGKIWVGNLSRESGTFALTAAMFMNVCKGGRLCPPWMPVTTSESQHLQDANRLT